ncbi:MAG: CHAD domain-containing protein, partial [Flavobacteriales bacterium]
ALLHATGPLRDSQVREAAMSEAGARAARALLEHAKRERKRNERMCRRALRSVDSGRLRGMLAAPLSRLDDRAASTALHRALEHRRARLRRRIAALRPGDALALHRARVALKRYRSLVAAFERHAGPEAAALLPALKRLQRRLGDWHDARLRAEWMRSAADGLPAPQRGACEREARALLAACEREEAALIRALKRLRP